MIVAANDDNRRTGLGVAGTRGATVTVDTRTSKVILPITGGAGTWGRSASAG